MSDKKKNLTKTEKMKYNGVVVTRCMFCNRVIATTPKGNDLVIHGNLSVQCRQCGEWNEITNIEKKA